MQHRQQAQVAFAEADRHVRRVPGTRNLGHLGRRDVAGHVGGAVAAQAHGGHHQPQVGRVAAHHRHIGTAAQHLRHLAHARGRFLVHHVVRVLEDAQQLVPVQVALDPGRVVVDAQRQVGGVGHFEEIGFGVGFGGADIGRRGQDRAVGAVGARELQVVDGGIGVVAGAAVEQLHPAGLHLGRLDDHLAPFFGRQQRDFTGGAHDQHGGGAVVFLELQQAAEGAEIDAAVAIERRDDGDEGPLDFHFAHDLLHMRMDCSIKKARLARGGWRLHLTIPLAAYAV